MYSIVRNYCVRQYYKTMSLCSVGLSVFTRGGPLGSFADLDVFKIRPLVGEIGASIFLKAVPAVEFHVSILMRLERENATYF